MWLEYGFWAIEEKATQTFAGELGFADFARDLQPRLQAPEAGWVLASHYHGRGYGCEALRAVLAWADARFPSTACLIQPENAASIRLARKCGYEESARTVYKGQATIVFHRGDVK